MLDCINVSLRTFPCLIKYFKRIIVFYSSLTNAMLVNNMFHKLNMNSDLKMFCGLLFGSLTSLTTYWTLDKLFSTLLKQHYN